MEDYKKKYEQALERARKWAIQPTVWSSDDICQKIFPELKESEDERIRKSIIGFLKTIASLKDGKTVSNEDFDSVALFEWAAWLEKQGEIKRSDYPYIPGWRENRPDNKPKIKHSILMLTTHGVAEGEWLGEEWCQYRWSCKVKDTQVLYWLHLSDLETLEKENIKRDFSWLEKKSEQKPNFCHHEVDFSDCSEEYRKAYYDGWNNCNQQHAQLEAEQKPAWSEEDAKQARQIERIVHDSGCTHKLQKQIADWLKSIKNRVKPQPKKEWSEEDEKILGKCIDAASGYYSPEDKQSMKDWLKSLKERMKGE